MIDLLKVIPKQHQFNADENTLSQSTGLYTEPEYTAPFTPDRAIEEETGAGGKLLPKKITSYHYFIDPKKAFSFNCSEQIPVSTLNAYQNNPHGPLFLTVLTNLMQLKMDGYKNFVLYGGNTFDLLVGKTILYLNETLNKESIKIIFLIPYPMYAGFLTLEWNVIFHEILSNAHFSVCLSPHKQDALDLDDLQRQMKQKVCTKILP